MVLRVRADACPGVIATHEAADGAVARVRLPGGRITAAQLRVLAECARDLGDGSIHLTSRGNVQLRGLAPDDKALIPRLRAAGLLPAPRHERVRNILASPLSGLRGGLVDVRPLISALDAAVCARAETADLPGRFLFALDDGRGDVAGEDPDVCWQARKVDATRSWGTLLIGGRDTGLVVSFDDAVATLVESAIRFAAVRKTAWRVRELPDPGVLIGRVLEAAPSAPPMAPCPLGEFQRDDGGRGMVVAPVLGQLSARQASRIADFTDWAVVTPWRSIVLPVAAEVSDDGLITDPAAPAARISACIGRPGCARSRADVRAQARRLMLEPLPADVRIHVSGCERRCGKPRQPCMDVVAGQHKPEIRVPKAGTRAAEESTG